MPYPHQIRLRGPWQYEVIQRSAVQAPGDAPRSSGSVIVPSDWGVALGETFRGRVRFTRRFGRPTGLDPHERVRIVCEGVDPAGALIVNGRHLGQVAGYALPAAHDITDLLKPRNTVELDINFPAAASGQSPPRPGREDLPGGPIGEVRLEVLSTHWLDDFWLDVRDDGQHAHLVGGGLVAGPVTAHPLELLIRGQSAELYYGRVEPGRTFDFTTPLADFPLWAKSNATPVEELTVKLLQGGTSLWQRQLSVGRRSIDWNARTSTLTIAGHEWTLPVELGHLSHTRSDARPAIRYAPQLMRSDWYAQADLAIGPLIQQMPITWSQSVCPRLAHHPSIVAWTTSSAELSQLSAPALKSTFGRPWIG